MSKYIAISLALLFLWACSLALSNEKQIIKEHRLGGFNLGSKLINNAELVSLLGEGCVDRDFPYHYQRLYYFAQEKIYAAFNIGTDALVVGLKLTTKPITSETCKAIKSLTDYETSKKISLGDTMEKVIEAYGRPAKEEIKNENARTYRYYVGREEGPYMEIEISGDRVITIFLTVGD